MQDFLSYQIKSGSRVGILKSLESIIERKTTTNQLFLFLHKNNGNMLLLTQYGLY